MKLLAYVHLHRLENPTGVGRVIDNMVRGLHALAPLEVLAQQRDIATIVPRLDATWQAFRYHGFKRSVALQQMRWLIADGQAAENWAPDIDIVYSPSEAYVPTRRARSAATIHDTAYFERGAHPGGLADRWQKLKWTWLHHVIARRVDLIHTVSHFSAARLAHFFPAMSPRIRVAHNGISDFFRIAGPDDAALAARHNPDGRRFVLLPGGLSYRKNADLVLAAWPTLAKLHPDLRLLVTSTGDPAYLRLAAELPSVALLGFVDDAVLRALYRGAAVTWFPSRYEGFGIPVVEAMASGSPVVASDASSLPEIGADAALYAGIDDPAAHVALLDGLLRDDRARSMLVERGIVRSAGFTWKRAAATLHGHLLEIA